MVRLNWRHESHWRRAEVAFVEGSFLLKRCAPSSYLELYWDNISTWRFPCLQRLWGLPGPRLRGPVEPAHHIHLGHHSFPPRSPVILRREARESKGPIIGLLLHQISWMIILYYCYTGFIFDFVSYFEYLPQVSKQDINWIHIYKKMIWRGRKSIKSFHFPAGMLGRGIWGCGGKPMSPLKKRKQKQSTNGNERMSMKC